MKYASPFLALAGFCCAEVFDPCVQPLPVWLSAPRYRLSLEKDTALTLDAESHAEEDANVL